MILWPQCLCIWNPHCARNVWICGTKFISILLTLNWGYPGSNEDILNTDFICFMVSHLGAVVCLLATSRQNWWMDFYEIFMMCRLWHKEQSGIRNIWGLIGLTPLIQESFFYFLDPCFLSKSRNNGWIAIHYVLRIWTNGAISYTVSRLNRLFHAPETRHSGSLRSTSASRLPLWLSIISKHW